MIDQKYKTRFTSIVPKNTTGRCIGIADGRVHALKLEFSTGECFWFLSRDLVEVE